MPRISAFNGIVATMYWRDHPPAHFHAAYAAKSPRSRSSHSSSSTAGCIRARRLVKEWAELHQADLRDNWDRARAHAALLPIEPLP